jgi:hypothetical protein
MTSTLTLKELRESAALAALGLVGMGLLAVSSIGLNPLGFMISSSSHLGTIPFVYDSFTWQFALAAGALAIALGYKQSIGDLMGGAQLFWLHRPVSRRTIYLTKLLVGLSLYLTIAAVPLVTYSLWAASSGTHASPFSWSMTVSAWTTWLAISVVYLGAFLSGIRPAAWLGTRLMPLIAACAVAAIAAIIPPAGGIVVALIVSFALVALIIFVVETRDFA